MTVMVVFNPNWFSTCIWVMALTLLPCATVTVIVVHHISTCLFRCTLLAMYSALY